MNVSALLAYDSIALYDAVALAHFAFIYDSLKWNAHVFCRCLRIVETNLMLWLQHNEQPFLYCCRTSNRPRRCIEINLHSLGLRSCVMLCRQRHVCRMMVNYGITAKRPHFSPFNSIILSNHMGLWVFFFVRFLIGENFFPSIFCIHMMHEIQ